MHRRCQTLSSRLSRGGTLGTPRVKPPSHQKMNVLSTQHTSSATPCSAKNFCTGISHCIAVPNSFEGLYAGDHAVLGDSEQGCGTAYVGDLRK